MVTWAAAKTLKGGVSVFPVRVGDNKAEPGK